MASAACPRQPPTLCSAQRPGAFPCCWLRQLGARCNPLSSTVNRLRVAGLGTASARRPSQSGTCSSHHNPSISMYLFNCCCLRSSSTPPGPRDFGCRRREPAKTLRPQCSRIWGRQVICFAVSLFPFPFPALFLCPVTFSPLMTSKAQACLFLSTATD